MPFEDDEKNDFQGIEHFSEEDQEKIKAVRKKVRECINMLKTRYPNDSMFEILIERIEPRHINTQDKFEAIVDDFFQDMEIETRLRKAEVKAFLPKKVTLFGQNIKIAINTMKKKDRYVRLVKF